MTKTYEGIRYDVLRVLDSTGIEYYKVYFLTECNKAKLVNCLRADWWDYKFEAGKHIFEKI